MYLRSCILLLLILASGARRSIRIDDSQQEQQNNTLANSLEVSTETQEALYPNGFFRRAVLQKGAAVLQEGASAEFHAVEASVVKLFVTRQPAAHHNPWNTHTVQTSSGSGAIIRMPSGGLAVLTAAHVVADALVIQVQRSSDVSSEKLPAVVRAVSHGTDLALVDVPGIANNPLEITDKDKIPELRSKIQVVGFPIGGDKISVTVGVVSRVEVIEYSHSHNQALALTVDAAINAGNSGGPVISDGKIIGVAFQKLAATGVEGQGHVVPPCLIHRFLQGVEANRDLTLPSLRFKAQLLEAPALRQRFCTSDCEGGVLVLEVSAGPGEEVVLERHDVIKKINNYSIDNLGTVMYLGHRVEMAALLGEFFVGDELDLVVERDGLELELTQKLLPTRFLVPRGLHDQPTPFFIVGGLVFQKLSLEYLLNLPASNPCPHLWQLYNAGILTEDRTEVVIMSQLLSHKVNVGFNGGGMIGSPVVALINDQPVLDLADAYAKSQRAVHESDFLEIELESKYGTSLVVLESSIVPAADAEIQQMYRLPQLASDNFLTV